MGNDLDRITFELNNDEALVFYNWLSKFNENEELEFEDQSEERILWDLESILEKSISAIVQGDYQDRVRLAQERLRDQEE